MKKLSILILSVVLFSSCAGYYKNIEPRMLNYQNTTLKDNVSFSYKFDVLQTAGNKRYAKKEAKSYIKVVAIKIENNSNQSFVVGRDLKIHANGNPVNLMQPESVKKQVKQTVPFYFFYLLLTPLTLNVETPSSQSSTPIGLAVGPGLTAYNVGVAASANSKFLNELRNYSIEGRTVQPGETVYGLVGISGIDFTVLTLE